MLKQKIDVLEAIIDKEFDEHPQKREFFVTLEEQIGLLVTGQPLDRSLLLASLERQDIVSTSQLIEFGLETVSQCPYPFRRLC